MKTKITITLDHNDLHVGLGKALAVVTPETVSQGDNMTWGALLEATVASSELAVTVEHTGGWLAGWNKPGYLPDDEPQLFDTFNEARNWLRDELERGMEGRLEDCTSSDDSKRVEIRRMYELAIFQVNNKVWAREDFVSCGKYVWWIRPEVDA